MKTTKHSEILVNELKATMPLYILGMVFHSITLYIMLLIVQITGTILDMILQNGITNEQIMKELYKLLFTLSLLLFHIL